MDYLPENYVYRQLVTVYHGPSFGHYIEMETAIKGRKHVTRVGLGNWKGLGIPEHLMRTASGIMVAAFEEHLVTRYGIQGELPTKWGGEPDPF